MFTRLKTAETDLAGHQRSPVDAADDTDRATIGQIGRGAACERCRGRVDPKPVQDEGLPCEVQGTDQATDAQGGTVPDLTAGDPDRRRIEPVGDDWRAAEHDHGLAVG